MNDFARRVFELVPFIAPTRLENLKEAAGFPEDF